MIRNFAAPLMRNFAVICGVSVVLIGLSFFAGVAGGVLGGNAVGSVCFIFLGSALFCYGRRIPSMRSSGRMQAAVVVVVAVLSGVQGSARLWAADGGSAFAGNWPGLPKPMAIGTAVAFILGSLALLTSS